MSHNIACSQLLQVTSSCHMVTCSTGNLFSENFISCFSLRHYLNQLYTLNDIYKQIFSTLFVNQLLISSFLLKNLYSVVIIYWIFFSAREKICHQYQHKNCNLPPPGFVVLLYPEKSFVFKS